ncbi:MAG: undecaprenyl-diphosphate phosphatase [Alphaproteobacteria bacterium]
MFFAYLFTLALVQGLTEFLPVSSSGHLVLVHAAFGGGRDWESHMLLDVAVHVGTLCSVLLYFRADVLAMLAGVRDWLAGRYDSKGARLNIHVLVSSIPVMVAGYILHALEPPWLLSVWIVAWTTLLFGIVLWIADLKGPVKKQQDDMGMRDALIIGCAQALALVPGTSRSGITMTAARFLGYSRTEAARYSLLLAIVAISGAGLLGGLDLVKQGDVKVTTDVLMTAFLSFVAGWVSISLMMKWLAHATFTIFAIYRVILGVGLLILLYTGIIS